MASPPPRPRRLRFWLLLLRHLNPLACRRLYRHIEFGAAEPSQAHTWLTWSSATSGQRRYVSKKLDDGHHHDAIIPAEAGSVAFGPGRPHLPSLPPVTTRDSCKLLARGARHRKPVRQPTICRRGGGETLVFPQRLWTRLPAMAERAFPPPSTVAARFRFYVTARVRNGTLTLIEHHRRPRRRTRFAAARRTQSCRRQRRHRQKKAGLYAPR